MHLKSLHLSGFKSFVEPTVLHFPNALCGVVGPNGCGKSNIVDALRWVMGATSSQSLRGSVMADVIFNGSAKRKPLELASVLALDYWRRALRGLPLSSEEASSLRLMVNMPECEAQP